MALIPADETALAPSLTTKPRKVLDEDDYIEKLETIIQRDYFPDIPKLKAQMEYVDAVKRNDIAAIRRLQMKYSRRRTDLVHQTPRDSPSTFETPDVRRDKLFQDESRFAGVDTNVVNPSAMPTETADVPAAEKGKMSPNTVVIDDLGLDSFLTKYTSEDDASFQEIWDLQAKREREKYKWMFEAEKGHNESHHLAIEASMGSDNRPSISYRDDARPNKVDGWSYTAHNAVMWVPPGVGWSADEKNQRRKIAERQILSKNTRFDSNPFSESAKKQSMERAVGVQAAVNKGRVDMQGVEVASSFAHPMQRFSFVATPSPAPGVNESPFMTWGEIEGTPFRLDAGDMPLPCGSGPSFKIPEVPQRDQIARDLTEEASKFYRHRKEKAKKHVSSGLLTPKLGSTSSVERLSNMSPAARRLATSKLGIRLGTDKALKASYTPSPRRLGGPDSTPLLSTTPLKSFTPSVRAGVAAPVLDEPPSVSLTDNLLNLNTDKAKSKDIDQQPAASFSKRARAEDFF